MKILVISSCTNKKKNEFRKEKMEMLKDKQCPAIEMYTGKQHDFTVKGVKYLWNRLGKEKVGFYILSAGYGLIPYDEIIIPYDCTFNTMHVKDIKERSKKLGISRKYREISEDYDLIYFLLGKEYLIALGIIDVPKSKEVIFFTSKSNYKYIPETDNVTKINAAHEEAKDNNCGIFSLKGKMFCKQVKLRF